VLVISGYLIGVPPPSIMGEAGEGYVMGYIRFTHMSVSYLFVVGILFRVLWAIVGNKYARSTFMIPFWSKRWCRDFGQQLGWFLCLPLKPRHFMGPDPVSRVINIFLFFLPCLVLIVSGFGMYAEAAGRDSWQYMVFGWLSDFSSNTQDWHTIHRVASWTIVLYALIHIYIVVHNEIVSDTTFISTMISGRRFFRKKKSKLPQNETIETKEQTS
jgi:Ni/Fe-hydrogenase 1 B-type cytochrome subunit